MERLLFFVLISIVYVVIAKLTSYDVAILAAVTTLVLFEIDRRVSSYE